MSSKLVTVVGFGRLGKLVLDELLALPGVRVRVAVRSPDKLEHLPQGVEVVRLDVTANDEGAAAAAVRGAYAVVSVLQGGADVLVDGQLRLLRAAVAEGVHRVIPSTFSVNFVAVPRGLVMGQDDRIAFAEAAEKIRQNVEVVHILNGTFMDRHVFGFLRLFDAGTESFGYFGDGSTILEMTTWNDTARYAAAAAVDGRHLPRLLAVCGDTVPVDELGRRYCEAKGVAVKPSQHRGTIADLEAQLQSALQTQPTNMYAWLPLQYLLTVMRGYGRLPRLANELFPNIHPLTFEQALKMGVF